MSLINSSLSYAGHSLSGQTSISPNDIYGLTDELLSKVNKSGDVLTGELFSTISPSTADSLSRKGYVDTQIATRVSNLDFATAIANYVLTTTFNTEMKTQSDAIATKLATSTFNSTIANYSTTTLMNSAIASSLVPYFNKTEINNFLFRNEAQVQTLINNALVGYYTQAQINGFDYASTSAVNTAISNAIVNYYDKTAIDNKDFRSGSQVQSAINTSISHLATVNGTDQQIINALTAYVSNTSLQNTLTNYVLGTTLTSNYSTSTTNANTYKTIASYNSEMKEYLTSTQIANTYVPLTTKVIPYTETGNPQYQFSVKNKGFLVQTVRGVVQNSQAYAIEITDANNITTSLLFGSGAITTPHNFQDITPAQFAFLTNLTGNVQNAIDARALITDLNNYYTKSAIDNTFIGYSTTQQLNTILQSYATTASLSGYVGSQTLTDNHFTKAQSDARFTRLDGTNWMTGSINSSATFPLYFSKETNTSNKFITQILDTTLYQYVANPGNTEGCYYLGVTGSNVAMVQQVSFYTSESAIISGAVERLRITPTNVNVLNEFLVGDTTKNLKIWKNNVASNIDFKNTNMRFNHISSTDVLTQIMQLTSSRIDFNKPVYSGNINAEDVYALTLNLPAIANGVLFVDSTGLVNVSGVTSTTLNFLDPTSSIQSQFNNLTKYFQGTTSNNITSAGAYFTFFQNKSRIINHQGAVAGGWSFDSYDSNGYYASPLEISSTGTIYSSSLTGNRVLIADANKNIVSSGITNTELAFLSGLNSNLQNQINSKVTLNGGDINLADGNSLFIGPSNLIALRLHHTNGVDSYIDYGTNGLNFRRNDGNNNVITGMVLNSEGKVAFNSGAHRDAVNIRGALNLENVSPWDNSNYIRWIQSFAGGNTEIRQYPGLDATGAIAQIRWRMYPSNGVFANYPDILAIQDNLAGDRRAILNGVIQQTDTNFVQQTMNRTGAGLYFGVGTEYKINNAVIARSFGGYASYDNSGYYAINVANAGAMGNSFSDSQFYLTNLKTVSNLDTHVKSLRVNNSGSAGLNIQYSGDISTGHSMFSFVGESGFNNILRLSYDANPTILYDDLNVEGVLRVKSSFRIQAVYPTQYWDNTSAPLDAWAFQSAGGDMVFYRRTVLSPETYTIRGTFNGSSGNYAPSDIRLKEDVQPLDKSRCLDKILGVNLVSYLMKDRDVGSTKRNIGVIAQEAQVINPYCVKEMYKTMKTGEEDEKESEKILTVSYEDLFKHNLGATQTLYGFIQAQQTELNALKTEMASLKDIIAQQNTTLAQVVSLLNSMNN